MGDPNMAFNAGVTSMGEGGGATMEGIPGMPGMPEGAGPAPMAMVGSPMGMGPGAGGMEMPNLPGPGAQEPNLMSKQFIEGAGGTDLYIAITIVVPFCSSFIWTTQDNFPADTSVLCITEARSRLGRIVKTNVSILLCMIR